MTQLLTHISPDTIALRLLALPEELAEAEMALHLLEERRRVAVEVLQRSEDRLLTDPEQPINGKNEATRAAQLRAETQTEREALSCAEYRVTEAKIVLRRLQNEHSSLRAVARLLGGVE